MNQGSVQGESVETWGNHVAVQYMLQTRVGATGTYSTYNGIMESHGRALCLDGEGGS